MLSFITTDQVESYVKNREYSAVYVGIAAEAPKESETYKILIKFFPALDMQFNPPRTDLVEGNVFTMEHEGITFFFGVIKNIDKYQANLMNILVSLRFAYYQMRKARKDNLLVFPLNSKLTKLQEAIIYPVLVDEMNLSGINTKFMSNEHEGIVSVQGLVLNLVPNSWRDNWMMSQEDLLFIFIMKDAMSINRGLAMSKSRMLLIYEIMHSTGKIYSQFEFTESSYGGKYFKQFPQKLNGLLNHGVLMDTMWFSKENRTDYREGPAMQHLFIVAKDVYDNNRLLIRECAEALKQGLIRAKMEKRDNPEGGQTSFQKPGGSPSQSNSTGGW